jgi:hypothetical protein
VEELLHITEPERKNEGVVWEEVGACVLPVLERKNLSC